MPKINVYLPEELANAVREAGIPVSPVCQKALAEAVHSVTLARKGIAAIRDPDLDPARLSQIAGRLDGRMTTRLREALSLARQAAGASTDIQTKHLLIGLLEQGDNLAVRLLQTTELDTDGLRAAAESVDIDEPRPAAAPPDPAGDLWSRLTLPARSAIAATLEASLDFGHNYLGCEHLLIGLLADTTTGAGSVLRSFGVEAAALRRAVTAAVAGFAQARQSAPEPPATRIDELIGRLDAIERRLGTAGI
jgi:ATP-dependent Clp protease ATP-binding subunit ClpC